ncbi:mannosyltransferase [Mycolicibacterium arenosum]|uniref:Mannosyltransferase n=1 Tax=Mycolicibacterium arenosum TaxID=2952157 RepID=A0ABT1LV80_9MYCO|nr:mannosyltransferase [Mycolicibacterium sp. CAU 1645]MCP9270808.1 mannosyltransferase [Mycolicibacterium sp. CAU 1645]
MARVVPIDSPSTRAVPSPPRRLVAAAPYLLLLSLAVRVAVTYLMPNGSNFIDLHVYVDGAAAIDRGELYLFTYHPATPPLPLQFTYPPFAALLFYPLHWLPFPVVGLGWQVGVAAALYGGVSLTLLLLGRYDARMAMLWTAVGVWIEPARHLFELGQIGALLMVMVLAAVYSNRWWLSGVLVGLAAGVKLTPAVSGLYFLGARRWRVVVSSAAVFLVTVTVSVVVLRDQGVYYFTDLLGRADRVGQVGLSTNQSLRGVVALVTGRDDGYGPLLIGLVALTVALAALAWRAVDADDRLGRILVVMTLGLLLSPVSWTHHWIWLLPLIMWLFYGSLRERTRVLGWVWLVLAFAGTPWIVQALRESGEIEKVTWYVALAGAAYVLGALVTLGYLASLSRRSR